MGNEKNTSEGDYLSPKDIQQWALQEIQDSAKAHELRLKGATELATAYALGELTSAQAHERLWQHHHRWGEALPLHVSQATNDEQILSEIDKAKGEYLTPQELGERFRERFGKRSGSGPSR